jgi:hypothetical protein
MTNTVTLSPTVAKVVALLQRPTGATLDQLVKRVPQAKPAYIAALLYGILPGKGIEIDVERDDDGTRRYKARSGRKITARKASKAA